MTTGKKWKWQWLLLACWPAALMGQEASAPERHEMSIQQAIDYASRHNVDVKNALIDLQIQQQTNREVTGSAYQRWFQAPPGSDCSERFDHLQL